MNLYLVSQDDNTDYDSFDSFICAANTVEEARNMLPSSPAAWDSPFSAWARSPDLVDVELIGLASPQTEPGVILASFNAG